MNLSNCLSDSSPSTGSHLHPSEPEMGRLSPRYESAGSRSRSHSRGSRSVSPSGQQYEKNGQNSQRTVASEEQLQKSGKATPGKASSPSTEQVAVGAKQKKTKKQQSSKKQQQQQEQQQQQQQQPPQLQQQISGHGSRCDSENSVIHEEEENGEEPDKFSGKESGGWKRGQSAERRPRSSTSSTTTAKSRKFFDQWKQAASMSKLGNRTKNLLGKWKSHSQSVDIVLGNSGGSGPATPGANTGNNASGVRLIHDGLGGHHGVMGSDPGSTDGHAFAVDKPEPQKGKAQWSEHVWTAWVHRGFSDDVTELSTVQPGADLLTEFQKDKFRHFFFHVLDLNSDCVISAEDFEKLNERIRHYMDWSVNSIQYLALKEVHGTFLECFLNTAANFAKKNDEFDYWDPFKRLDALYDKMLQDRGVKDVEAPGKTCVSIDEWVDVWGILVGKAKKMDDFPMWLQYYPKVLFDVINRSGTGVISKSELKYFYTAFMDVGKLGEQRLDEITTNAYRAMTSDGDVRLTYHIYKLSFLNFLLGKQPNGPGQYIFGTVLPAKPSSMFPIDYSALNASEEDIEPYRHEKLEEKGSRRSVIV